MAMFQFEMILGALFLELPQEQFELLVLVVIAMFEVLI
jgi:hypothetical protein